MISCPLCGLKCKVYKRINNRDVHGIEYSQVRKYVCPFHGDVTEHIVKVPGRFR